MTAIGLVAVFSSVYFGSETLQESFPKQFIYFIIGYIVYFVIATIDTDWLKQLKLLIPIYTVTIITLVLLLVQGTVIAETKRWIDVGFISIQPSEFAKLIVILLTAAICSNARNFKNISLVNWNYQMKIPLINKAITPEVVNIGTKVITSLLLLIPILFLIYKQPSLGNMLISLSIWLAMILSLLRNPLVLVVYATAFTISLVVATGAGAIELQILLILALIITMAIGYSKRKLFNFAVLFSCVFLGLIIGRAGEYLWNDTISEYQQDRILSFINPEADPQGQGWQVQRSKIAIASAPIPFGFGFLQGPQTNSGYLPFAHTDFIFASFTEQFGILGGLLLILIEGMMIYRMLLISDKIPNSFGKFAIIGITAMFTLNLLINVGMNLGIMPVTGIPLPLISYGGSSVLVNMIGAGLVQSFYAEGNSELGIKQKVIKLI